MKKYRLSRKRRTRKPLTTDSNHPFRKFPNLIRNVISIVPDHIWASDITYVRLKHGFCYVAAIIDIFTKNIRGWSIGMSLEKGLALEALTSALKKAIPKIHHSDQGVQYCSYDYVEILQENNILISMSDTGEPTQNAYAERFFRTLKVEEIYLMEYDTIEDAKRSITRFIETVYTQKRLHQSLGYQTPEEFEAVWYQQNKGQASLQTKNPGIEQNSLLAAL